MSNKNFDDVLFSRRSIRKFTKEEVPDKDVYAIIDAARYAPSNGNVQPWYFIVIKDEETKSALRNLVDESYNKLKEQSNDNLKGLLRSFHRNVRLREAPVYIFAFCDMASASNHPYSKELINKLEDRKLQELWNEAIKQSVAGAIQNILLKAEEMGYSTCLIGGPYYLKEKIEEFFGLPQHYKFYSCIILGKKDEEPPHLPKKPLEDILEFFPLNLQEIYEYLQENTDNIIKEHSIRVKEIAKQLQEKIGGDKRVIECSSLLHDIAFKYGFKNHAERGATLVYEKFKIKWRKDFLEKVCNSIRYHSIASPPIDDSPEVICLYDADKIDFLINMPKRILKEIKIDEEKIYASILHPYSKELFEELRNKPKI
jgi:nitroreductase/HD superfamily phosphodiesterase